MPRFASILHRLFPMLLLQLLAACAEGAGGPKTPCEAVCHELVVECAYNAYPSMDSCMQGCTYLSENGADIDARRTCVEAAQCDTFAVVACERDATAAPQP